MATDTQTRPAPSSRRFRFNFVDTFLWSVRIFAVFVLIWGILGAISLSAQGDGLSADAWKDLTVTGLAQGSMYGLVALGYSMVYGVLGFINFAHGEVFMAGGVVGFFAADALFEAGVWDDNWVLSIGLVILVAMTTSTVIAVLVERIAYKPLRGAPRLIPLITSIGASFFIQYSFRGLFGSGFLTYPQLPETLRGDPIGLFGFDFQRVQLLVIAIAAVSMVGLYFFVTKTKAGRAMRAVAEDKEIAGLMGINVDRTIVTTFAVGGAMAGVAGALWAMLFRQVNFLTGFLPGIKAFTAAVLGGIGNMAGAYLGGLTLGLFEALGPQVVLGGLKWDFHVWKILAIALGIWVVAAIVRPELRLDRRWQTMAAFLAAATMIFLAISSLRDIALAVDIPSVSQLKDVVAFTALVLVLIFRPTGLLGERLAVEERG